MKSEKRSNRRSCSGLFCFGGPRVNDSDVQPPAAGGREKKKVLAHSPARSRPVRDGDESRPKKSSAEVETRTLEELEELLEFSSQNRTSLTRIMLDNMVVPLPNGDVDVSMLKDAVQLVNGRFETKFFCCAVSL
ncbi:nicotinate-nucleotide pyrophosphorylase [carboxylating], chloroplastic-like isoform X2 [Zingiber officinale]|uniref:nicotinate-nucleotide pyrophosphorylase [carboxylating], chloroplastic-like isoform X2 n=1 Tax=Zingiber officinale TaxID=94328 RepID=UPI001C4C33BE|nr:nicotinate-nucleotide pyrophosphorylase [carboxylating], chloroplastic-like isoform X2 [Zingiber officinale]XP_042382022.1 nicotinate-nucleotide pyrophosphorylase [carboxylating], chloroplastic-like isoform X2 [Zingiber officinale]